MQRDAILCGLLSLALGACTTTAPTTTVDNGSALDLATATSPEVPDRATAEWPTGSNCGDLVGRLAALDEAAASRLSMNDAPLVLVAADADAPTVQRTLPIPDALPTAAGQSPCAIVVGRAIPAPATSDRIRERRTVHSAYPTGVKRRRNPEYAALETELTRARRGTGDEIGIASTGDPLMDLVGTVASGVIGGIGAVWQQREVRAIEAELATTPAFIEDAIMTPYRYELVDLEAARAVTVPVALHDDASGQTWTTALTLTETRRFAVADARHPQDMAPQNTGGATLLTSAALAAWRDATPPIDTAVLLAHLAAASRGQAGQPASLAATIARLRASEVGGQTVLAAGPGNDEARQPGSSARSNRERSPRLPAGSTDPTLLVEPAAGPSSGGANSLDRPAFAARPYEQAIVQVGDAELPGFYVTSEHILTPASALGRSSLVAVRHADGMRAHGLIELVDDALGLALVFVPRPGEALTIQRARSARPATQGRPGIPWTTDGQVIGVFVEDASGEGQRWIDGAAIDRFIVQLADL